MSESIRKMFISKMLPWPRRNRTFHSSLPLLLIIFFFIMPHSLTYATYTSSELENISELYYNAQKIERKSEIGPDFAKLASRYPCIKGMIPIGNVRLDGHKWICGLEAIKGNPVVYSFGSFGDQTFEVDLLKVRPDADINIFEIISTRLPPLNERNPKIKYHAIGLGGYQNDNSPSSLNVKPLWELMLSLNHTYIDILKMDIEGMEFTFLKHEAPHIFHRVGQFQVELHIKRSKGWFAKTVVEDAVYFVEKCEEYGLRLFSNEPNFNHVFSATELAFIQSKWTDWDNHKHKFHKSLK